MKTDDKPYHTVTENSRQNPVISKGGSRIWYNELGQRHREDGPAVEYAGGDKAWYLNNKLHREDGPAIEHASGSKHWYINNARHREDGPAYEGVNGSKEWWINNKYYSTIPEWVRALFIYKEHTPEKLGQERFDDLVRAFTQKMEDIFI